MGQVQAPVAERPFISRTRRFVIGELSLRAMVRHTTPRSSNERGLEGAHADISIAQFTGTVALAILGQRKPRKC